MSYKSLLTLVAAIVVLPAGVAYASANQAVPVTLVSSSPQVRTGQEVTLFASIPEPLLKGEVLSIIDQTTNQVIAQTSSGTTVSGVYETNQNIQQTFTGEITDASTPISVNWTDQGIGNNQGYANAAGQTVTISNPMEVTLGSPIFLNATASGFVSPVYQFWWAMQGGQWHQSGHYQSSSFYKFIPPRTGLIDVTVYTREATAPTGETALQRAQYEAKANTAVVAVNAVPGTGSGTTPTPSAAGWVSLTAANQVALGSSIVLAGNAVNMPQPVYQFWFWTPGEGWESSGHYTSANTYSVPASVLGQWAAVVYARPAAAPINETAAQRAEYEVNSPVSTIVVSQQP